MLKKETPIHEKLFSLKYIHVFKKKINIQFQFSMSGGFSKVQPLSYKWMFPIF